MKKYVIASSAALAAGFLSLEAYAQQGAVNGAPNNGWGQAVLACVDNPNCYNGGTRGSFVSSVATQNNPLSAGFGFAGDLHANAPAGSGPQKPFPPN